MRAGDRFPDLKWPCVGGGEMVPARWDGWRMLVVYRGKHCGLCREYLETLQALAADFAAARIGILALSADPSNRAEAQVRESGLAFPVGHDLSTDQMHGLGLYVSPPSDSAPGPFAEPAAFVIDPSARVHVACVSNAPFARPELRAMLDGIKVARRDGAPIHGLA